MAVIIDNWQINSLICLVVKFEGRIKAVYPENCLINESKYVPVHWSKLPAGKAGRKFS